MTGPRQRVDVEIVVPVHDEERVLQESIWRLHEYLTLRLSREWRITIVDSGSADGTLAIAEGLAATLPDVAVLHLPEKGRGRALKAAWGASSARVLAYLDADLSTDLAGLAPLLAPLLSGHSDLAIGTRLARTSRVVRGVERELVSRSYNALIRGALGTSVTDAQCGFKAVTRQAAGRLLPLVRDDARFFDTELLVLAERAGLRIHEVPVDWTDDPDSRVQVCRTAIEDLRGVVRLAADLARRRLPLDAVAAELGRGPLGGDDGPAAHLLRFGVVGALSTLAFGLLFLALDPLVGEQAADLLALLATSVATTGVNRWSTAGVTGGPGAFRHPAQGLLVFALAWAITAGTLVVLHDVAPGASPGLEVLALTAANLAVTALRFLLLGRAVLRARRPAPVTRLATPEGPADRADPLEIAS